MGAAAFTRFGLVRQPKVGRAARALVLSRPFEADSATAIPPAPAPPGAAPISPKMAKSRFFFIRALYARFERYRAVLGRSRREKCDPNVMLGRGGAFQPLRPLTVAKNPNFGRFSTKLGLIPSGQTSKPPNLQTKPKTAAQ